ncbi:MAG: SRPBCC domain-containing protein [Nitrososphaerota archaeon]|nr:SRPBCC domain-containing protein [Nitrososphaerota archaeon]MDG7024907.1 SRPBCC domain-containing protein [Nitrososphaerota archaeon]
MEWRGVWNGRPYIDRGKILEMKRPRSFSYSHFSPLSGLPDVPENYHKIRVVLTDDGGRTSVSLTQDNNPTEEARVHSEKNWAAMLSGLKDLVEKKGRSPRRKQPSARRVG